MLVEAASLLLLVLFLNIERLIAKKADLWIGDYGETDFLWRRKRNRRKQNPTGRERHQDSIDFGQSFNFGADYFTGWLAPRSINGLGDHFEFGLLPKIPGLYAKEQLAKTDFPYSEPEISAVFLSHGHFDHVAHICFIDPKIPVYLGAGTKLFMESMEETSSFCDYKVHNYRTFRTGKKITVDNIEVEPVHVDHSIPAAYGFIVRTGESTIVYTVTLGCTVQARPNRRFFESCFERWAWRAYLWRNKDGAKGPSKELLWERGRTGHRQISWFLGKDGFRHPLQPRHG